MPLSSVVKAKLVEQFGQNKADTGSTEVQVSLLTKSIQNLTEHMKANKKDKACQRGLIKQVSMRRRLLNYLKSKDYNRYSKLIADLGLRR